MGNFAIPAYTSFLICIVVLVIIGCLVALRLQQGAIEDDGSTSEDELRKGFELAYYAGEIDATEFKRVTAALDEKKQRGGRPTSKPSAPVVFPPLSPDPIAPESAEERPADVEPAPDNPPLPSESA